MQESNSLTVLSTKLFTAEVTCVCGTQMFRSTERVNDVHQHNCAMFWEWSRT